MLMQTTERPLAGEPFVPPYRHVLAMRLEALARAIGLRAGVIDPRFPGCLQAPCSNLAIFGTSCSRPLLLPEGRMLGQETALDVILLRHDVDRGSSFDVLLHGQPHWLLGYAAWARRGGDLWLIPTAGDGPFLRATVAGLEAEDAAPFHDAEERRRGIMRAIVSPTFEGSL